MENLKSDLEELTQIWNEIDESLKTLSKLTFKHELKEQLHDWCLLNHITKYPLYIPFF
jgi:hypothetical protein